MKILITAGGTREYIDGARFIGNSSSGKTASLIAEFFIQKKFKVVYLRSEYCENPKSGKCEIRLYSDFKSLNGAIKEILSENDIKAVIHAAAVSDYSVKEILTKEKRLKPSRKTKLSSRNKEIHLILKRNFKILNRLKNYSENKKLFIVGFKLTNNGSEKEITDAVSKLKADLVAHNDLSRIGKNHPFAVYKKTKLISKVKNSAELAKAIHKTIMEEKCF